MAPSIERQGYWGRPTSTLDWWNTVSNLIMILPPICGAIQTFQNGLEFRYVCSFLGLAAVGVGSWFFHMTLLYEMQLLDELPMIYSTCVFVYCLVYPWLRPLCYTSLGIFLFGFLLWNIDNIFCDSLSLQIRSTYLKFRPKVKFVCGVWPTLHIEPQKTT
ncbi:hypothetical protein INR49_030236 [Caranx melampygus]|nr:hypothetical protein INR49_011485 [Caranx melampygus]KAG7239049.1 hypothetical protein INR49_030236 [Caranx melampygus]